MANFLIDHGYTLDITPSARPQLVPVSEYDVGRIFTFTLKHNGEEMTIPSSYGAVTVEGTIGSYAFLEPASIENGKIVFQLTESMTAHAGKAWTKIKFANADAPISTCAFILAVDRAGVEAETVIGAPGFQEQINQGVAEYFDNDPPFFELPSGGQSGQALLSDGSDGAVWGEAGIPSAVKTALLACFRGVAWLNNNQGVDLYDALETALNGSAPTPPTPSVPTEYQKVEYIESNGSAYFETSVLFPLNFTAKCKCYKASASSEKARVAFGCGSDSEADLGGCFYSTTNTRFGSYVKAVDIQLYSQDLYDYPVELELNVNAENMTANVNAKINGNSYTNSANINNTVYSGKPIRVFYSALFAAFDGRIYALEVTDNSTRQVILNLVPVYRKSDNVVGMYDTVHSVFYQSRTAQPFTKGGDIA